MRIGSILHGAYGDYYEQLLCLKALKRANPATRLVLFFQSQARLREMRVFDLSFAEEVHLLTDINRVRVDRFHQFQVKEPELQDDLARLEAPALAGLDLTLNRKPWTTIRTLDFSDPDTDIGLGEQGLERLPECMVQNGIEPGLFDRRFTVGFLWRYREAGGFVSPRGQAPEEEVRRTKSELLRRLIREHGAHVLVCGMNVRVTEENRARVDAKFTESTLDLDPAHSTYLKGLSWGLELEILRRCSLCIVMASGFSEALWMKRAGPTMLVDTPRHYLLKLLWNRMPLFGIRSARELLFQLRQPHTPERVMRRLKAIGALTPSPHGAVGRTLDRLPRELRSEPAE